MGVLGKENNSVAFGARLAVIVTRSIFNPASINIIRGCGWHIALFKDFLNKDSYQMLLSWVLSSVCGVQVNFF